MFMMRRICVLTTLVLTGLFCSTCRVQDELEATASLNGDKDAPPSLDAEIKKYQLDAALCGIQGILFRVPGHSEIFHKFRCAASVGIDIQQGLRAAKSCWKNYDKISRFADCVKMGLEYFSANKEVMACMIKDHGVAGQLEKLGIFGSTVACSLTAIKGARLLNKAVAAANEARADAHQRADSVRRAIVSSQLQSRIFNLGFYRGCHAMVNVVDKRSDASDLDDEAREKICKQTFCNVNQSGWGPLDEFLTSPAQKVRITEACKLGCSAKEIRPIPDKELVENALIDSATTGFANSFINFLTDATKARTYREGCQDVINVARKGNGKFDQRIMFRVLRFPGMDRGTIAERYTSYLAGRVRVLAALNELEANWDKIANKQTRLATLESIGAFAPVRRNNDEIKKDLFEVPEADLDMSLAAEVFTTDYAAVNLSGKTVSYFGSLLDSATDGHIDGYIGLSDIAGLRFEIETYYLPCEGSVDKDDECKAFKDYAAQ